MGKGRQGGAGVGRRIGLQEKRVREGWGGGRKMPLRRYRSICMHPLICTLLSGSVVTHFIPYRHGIIDFIDFICAKHRYN